MFATKPQDSPSQATAIRAAHILDSTNRLDLDFEDLDGPEDSWLYMSPKRMATPAQKALSPREWLLSDSVRLELEKVKSNLSTMFEDYASGTDRSSTASPDLSVVSFGLVSQFSNDSSDSELRHSVPSSRLPRSNNSPLPHGHSSPEKSVTHAIISPPRTTQYLTNIYQPTSPFASQIPQGSSRRSTPSKPSGLPRPISAQSRLRSPSSKLASPPSKLPFSSSSPGKNGEDDLGSFSGDGFLKQDSQLLLSSSFNGRTRTDLSPPRHGQQFLSSSLNLGDLKSLRQRSDMSVDEGSNSSIYPRHSSYGEGTRRGSNTSHMDVEHTPQEEVFGDLDGPHHERSLSANEIRRFTEPDGLHLDSLKTSSQSSDPGSLPNRIMDLLMGEAGSRARLQLSPTVRPSSTKRRLPEPPRRVTEPALESM